MILSSPKKTFVPVNFYFCLIHIILFLAKSNLGLPWGTTKALLELSMIPYALNTTWKQWAV